MSFSMQGDNSSTGKFTYFFFSFSAYCAGISRQAGCGWRKVFWFIFFFCIHPSLHCMSSVSVFPYCPKIGKLDVKAFSLLSLAIIMWGEMCERKNERTNERKFRQYAESGCCRRWCWANIVCCHCHCRQQPPLPKLWVVFGKCQCDGWAKDAGLLSTIDRFSVTVCHHERQDNTKNKY